MAHEDAIVDLAAVLRSLARALAGAGEIGAVGEYIERDGDAARVAGEAEGADVDRQVRHSNRFAAGGRQAPHLAGAAARRQEINLTTVGRPIPRAVVFRLP